MTFIFSLSRYHYLEKEKIKFGAGKRFKLARGTRATVGTVALTLTVLSRTALKCEVVCFEDSTA